MHGPVQKTHGRHGIPWMRSDGRTPLSHCKLVISDRNGTSYGPPMWIQEVPHGKWNPHGRMAHGFGGSLGLPMREAPMGQAAHGPPMWIQKVQHWKRDPHGRLAHGFGAGLELPVDSPWGKVPWCELPHWCANLNKYKYPQSALAMILQRYTYSHDIMTLI